MATIWKDVKGYEGLYQVSNNGDVLALPRTKSSWYRTFRTKAHVLKPGIRGRDNLKYKFVVLEGNGKKSHKSVHRLVAEAFLENPDNLPEVNHKDKNTMNNSVDNLEWCTRRHNIEHAKAKGIKQYTVGGELVGEYLTARRASEATGIGRSSIENAVTGWSKTAGGFIWAH